MLGINFTGLISCFPCLDTKGSNLNHRGRFSAPITYLLPLTSYLLPITYYLLPVSYLLPLTSTVFYTIESYFLIHSTMRRKLMHVR